MNPIEVYDRFAPYYDLYVGEFSADIPLFINICRNRDSIVEIGCGSGRVLKVLLENGHKVLGIDISPAMLSIAGAKLLDYIQAGKLELLNHNLCQSPLPRRFSIMLATFYTANYLTTDADMLSFLQNAFDSLQSNGKIVLDLFYPQSLLDPTIDNQWRTTTFRQNEKTILLRQQRRFADNIETRTQVFFDGDVQQEIVTDRRYYDKLAIQELLLASHFNDVTFTENYNAASFHSINNNEKTASSFVVSAIKQYVSCY